MLKRLDAKTKFLRKFIPLVQLAREFAQERDAAVKRANDAEANARKAVEAELCLLREENRALRDRNLELTGSSRSMSLSFVCLSSFFHYLCLDLVLVCIAREASMSQLRTELE